MGRTERRRPADPAQRRKTLSEQTTSDQAVADPTVPDPAAADPAPSDQTAAGRAGSHAQPAGSPEVAAGQIVGAAAQAEPDSDGQRRPMRTFQAVGVFVLALGAVAGAYVAVGRSAPVASNAVPMPAVSEVGTTPPLTGEPDPAYAAAAALAEEKALGAAAAAAERARQASVAAQPVAPPATSRPSTPAPTPSRSATRTSAAPYPVPASCDAYAGHRATGCALLLDAGFDLDQMPCLDKLFAKESGWNPRARNPSSGAYGIPQALPGSKMAAFGEDWQTNPVPQIKWGLSYITGRYKTPCGAWSYFQANGWY